MPLLVHCTQCAAELTVDDGFRGGVCRCSSCGTLLSVPADPSDGKSAAPRRRQRPANPNQDPSLLRQNQEDLKQRTGSFPALTELIGSSSGLQGMRRPAQPAGDPSASALGLSPPSPIVAGSDASVAGEPSIIDQAASDLPTIAAAPPAPPAPPPPAPPPEAPRPVEPAPKLPAPAASPALRHPAMYLVLGILAGLLLIAALIYLFRPNPPAASPKTPAVAPETPRTASPPPEPATAPEVVPVAPAAPPLATEPTTEAAPTTIPAADTQPASQPAPTELPAATSAPASTTTAP